MNIISGRPAESGEEKAWELLGACDRHDVCSRAVASYDSATKAFIVPSFGLDVCVCSDTRLIATCSPEDEGKLAKVNHFYRLSLLRYLIHCLNIPETGRLVQPVNLREGQLFFRGSHVLPLGKIAERYGADGKGFESAGRKWGGSPVGYGDVSVKLYPFPRIPVYLLLWLGDDEFPARADLLFDSSCDLHIPVDVIWSTAMLTITLML